MKNRQLLDDAPFYLRDFITYMETIKGKSSNTVDEYFFDLRTFLRYMLVLKGKAEIENFDEIPIKDIPVSFIEEITLHDLYEYLSYTLRERLNNANSRARKVSSLRSFFKYMVTKAKLVETNPAAELDSPKKPKVLPRYLSLDESKQLLENVDGNQKYRDYAILTLFLNTGMRVSELVGLDLKSLNFSQNTVYVIRKGGKSNILYFNEHVAETLMDYIYGERASLLGPNTEEQALFLSNRKQRMCVKAVENVVKKFAQEAVPDKHITPHKLRSTYGTALYRQTGDIKLVADVLGHEDVNTTNKYYAASEEEHRKMAAKIKVYENGTQD